MLKVKIMNDMQTNSIPGLFIVCNSMSDPIIFFAGTVEKKFQWIIQKYHVHLFGQNPLEEGTF